MKFKLIIALVANEVTEKVVEVARRLGATGSTVITAARGEGLKPAKTFLGLTLEGQVDVALFIVEQHISRQIIEGIDEAVGLSESPGAGVAIQIDIEDAVGLGSQLDVIKGEIEDQI